MHVRRGVALALIRVAAFEAPHKRAPQRGQRRERHHTRQRGEGEQDAEAVGERDGR